MKKYKRNISYISIIICLLFIFPIVSFAHSGRTDSRGGHKDNNNKSGLGYYHYHCGGHPAHLHPDGVCPYSGYSYNNSGNNNSNYSNGSNYTNNSYQDYIVMKDYPKSLVVGEDIVLNFTMYSYYNDFLYTITSTNTSAIRVNGDVLEAVGVGTSDIIIETSHTSKTITIQVKEVFAEKFKIYSKLEKLQLGEKLSIVYRVEPNNTTNKNVEFSSSNTSVAIMEGDVIVPVSAGDVTITGKTSNGLTDSFDISIYEVFPEEIIPSIDSIKLELTDTYNLEYEIKPSNANDKDCIFICEDTNVAFIDENGLITPISDGNTNVIIQANANNISKSIPLETFHIPCEKIDIIDSSDYNIFSNYLDKSDSIILDTKITPDNATFQNVVWSSSDPDVVSVDNDGFEIKGTGEVTLTCTTNDNVSSNVVIKIIDIDSIAGMLIFIAIIIVTGILIILKIKIGQD